MNECVYLNLMQLEMIVKVMYYIMLKGPIRNTSEKLKRGMKELELRICFQQKAMKGPTSWDRIETY